MKRSLRLRKDVLTELCDAELEEVGGGDALSGASCPACIRTTPLLTCLFKCTE
ncbi:MAG TPA: hypothetical protein VF519_08815 [Mycobacteriales bacterium]|jgi:hypothetical protein